MLLANTPSFVVWNLHAKVCFAATNQPVDHLLQLDAACGAVGQEDHGARILVLLHSRQDEPAAPQPRLPRLPPGALPQPGVLGCVRADRGAQPRFTFDVSQSEHKSWGLDYRNKARSQTPRCCGRTGDSYTGVVFLTQKCCSRCRLVYAGYRHPGGERGDQL